MSAPPDAVRQVGEDLAAGLGDRVQFGVALAPFTTYRVGGPAAVFVRPASIDDLGVLARAVAAARGRGDVVELLVVGRGSNLLVADDGFDGVVVSTADLDDSISVEETPEGSTGRPVVRAGGGVALPVLARRTAVLSLTGFEWAVGVPGSVGGAVRMNAGGHGSDMAASLIDARVVDLATGEITDRPVGSLGLRFRGSDLGPDELVASARLQLDHGDREVSEAEIAEIVRWRHENQPGGQNAGSVFVNPVPGQVAAAQLIDGLGLRGMRIGSAEVSTKHANFIQADRGGTAADVRSVMEVVRAKVFAESGVLLRSEVRLIGFPEDVTSGEPGAAS